MRELPFDRFKPAHPYAWLWKSLEEDPTFALRSMFGAKAVYLDGKIMICFMAKKEPWCGLLICTERPHHPSLIADFPGLSSHKILGKWLYLPESNEAFETMAEKIVRAALHRDPRIGVVAETKKKKKRQP